MSNELENFINGHREEFDDKIPNPAILQRIQQQMGNAPKKKGIIISIRMIRVAAACLLLLAGGTIFLVVQKSGPAITTAAIQDKTIKQSNRTDASALKTPIETATATLVNTPKTNDAIKGVPKENQETPLIRQAIFAKLNNMQSPSSRVSGASEAYKLKDIDKETVDILVHTMNNDPNTNVRLAALDALTRFHGEPYVKKQLVRSLKKQTDPMVQIPLIQLLTNMRQTAIIHQLEKMVEDNNTMDAVKENAYSGILTLKS